MKVSLLNFVIFLVLLKTITGVPISYSNRHNNFGNFSADKLMTFMQKFGYLQEPAALSEGLAADFLYAETAVIDGIKKLQKFGGIDVTGVIDEETVKLMSAPRCGVKDVLNSKERQKRYIIGSKNWGKRQITYFIANWSPKVEQEKMEKWVEIAFHTWSLYSRLKFKRVYDSSADIIIAFGSGFHGDNYPFDGVGNVLAHAFYPYEANAFGGDIHFDNDENWKENATTLNEGVDFLTVLVHELGHSLGLAHSFVYSSIMFPYYKGVTPAQLDYDDILAMYQLYISRPLIENADDQTHTESSIINSESSATVEPEEVEKNAAASSETSDDDLEPIPDLCEGHFDSVANLNNDIYIFKGNYVWQFNLNFELEEDFPKKVNKVFPNLPKRFKKIDAAYKIPYEDEIIFFSGSEYITYDTRGPIYTAYNITKYTYDPEIERIDAAMIWTRNSKTYLFSSDRFWKYSEKRQMDPFYPRVMARWTGVPENLDGAISIPNHQTLFFKGNEYWDYDDKSIRPKPKKGFPRSVRELFDVCSDK